MLVIRLSPPYHEVHLNRGLLRAQLRDLSGAEADFRRTLEIKPLEWRALRELGNLWLGIGDAVAALEAYDAALQIEMRDTDLQANAGLAASELGDHARAIRHSTTAIALNPKHVGAHNNLAAELVALGRPNDALPHARLAAEHGEDPNFLVNLATIERLCGEENRSQGQGGAPTSH
jgi:tetratricopeptide (TPR) repeat protein